MRTLEAVQRGNAQFLNAQRLSAPTGPVAPSVEGVLRSLLTTAQNPLASAAEFDLHETSDGVRVYRADARPFSVNLESKPLHRRTTERMRREIWPDIKAHRDALFTAGPVFSALSGVELGIDKCHVDHHPRKFREIADGFLWQQSSEGAPSPDYWGDWTDWIAFHREAVGWVEPGRVSGLRLVTPDENNRLG